VARSVLHGMVAVANKASGAEEALTLQALNAQGVWTDASLRQEDSLTSAKARVLHAEAEG